MLFKVFCQWIVSGLVQFWELRYCYWGTEPIVCWHWFVVRVPETTVRSEGLPWWGNSHAALATFRGRRHSSCWDVTFLGNVFPETTLQRRPVESFTFYGRVFLGVQFSSCRGVRKDYFFYTALNSFPFRPFWRRLCCMGLHWGLFTIASCNACNSWSSEVAGYIFRCQNTCRSFFRILVIGKHPGIFPLSISFSR